MAKLNDNPNLVFAACNTQECQDAPQHFGVTGIPNFIAFVNGKVHKNFKGADMPTLQATVADLKSKIPVGK